MSNILECKVPAALIVAAACLWWVVLATADEVAATPADDVGTAGAGSPPPGGSELPETEEEFYQLCPKCGASNFPAAKYCAKCGKPLTPATKRLSGLWKYGAAVGATGTPYHAGGGVFARLDWDRFAWGGEYVFVGPSADENGDRQVTPHYLENLIRLFFQKRPFRPFFAIELSFRYEYVLNEYNEYYLFGPDVSRRYVIGPTLGAGLNVNYGSYASYVEFSFTAGSVGDTSSVYGNFRWADFAFKIAGENATYFWPRLGLLARGSFTSTGGRHDDGPFLLVSVGPVFTW